MHRLFRCNLQLTSVWSIDSEQLQSTASLGLHLSEDINDDDNWSPSTEFRVVLTHPQMCKWMSQFWNAKMKQVFWHGTQALHAARLLFNQHPGPFHDVLKCMFCALFILFFSSDFLRLGQDLQQCRVKARRPRISSWVTMQTLKLYVVNGGK